jgi:hypothetical protein
MPRWARPLSSKVRVDLLFGRFRAAVSAALLLVAVGASACSVHSSSPGRSLPISTTSSSAGIHPTNCTLNASGTQAVAVGKFSPSASLPVVGGQQVGALQLQLRVVTSQSLRVGHVVVHNPEVGEAVAGVSVGQTTWHLSTPIEQVNGLRPTRCVVTYGVFG